jgi:hypothetical protein
VAWHSSCQAVVVGRWGGGFVHGEAVQFDPLKTTLKLTGTERLEPNPDELHSSFAFDFNLRRYITACTGASRTRQSGAG